jgi:hypothetical protein
VGPTGTNAGIPFWLYLKRTGLGTGRSSGLENELPLAAQQRHEIESLKTRALRATVFKEVAELQTRLDLADSTYKELLSAAPQSEEPRSIEFELQIGNFRRTVDQLDAAIDSKRNEWRQRFGIIVSASNCELLDQLPSELGKIVRAMQTHNNSKVQPLPDHLERRGRRDPASE